MSTTRTAALITAGALAVLPLAACSSQSGGSSSASPSAPVTSAAPPESTAAPTPNGLQKMSASEILQASTAAIEAASSVKMTGTAPTQGQESKVQAELTANGSHMTVETGTAGSFEMIVTPEGTYIRGDETYRKLLGTEGQQMGDKWLAVPSEGQTQDGQALQSLTGFAAQISENYKDAKVDGTKEIDGVPTVVLSGSEGKIYFSTIGEPYPVKAESAPDSTSGMGTLVLSDWNAPVTVQAPPSDQVIALSDLTATPSP